MTQAGETEMDEDQGFRFWVVRMVTPSSTALETLAPDLQSSVRTNIERARRIFRSRTLPCPGSDNRLSAPGFDVWSLSSELDAVIHEGIQDKAALEILALPPTDNENEASMRIEIAQTGRDGDRRFETRSASSLLGKYWYRHQEKNIFDSIDRLSDLKAARERGQSGLEILLKAKPPAPQRRGK